MKRMPSLFVGHGSPMNALDQNDFTRGMQGLSALLPEKPRAILCVSAHWETEGTQVLSSAKPQTIHDFYGFPESLFKMTYSAPGAPTQAERVAENSKNEITMSNHWGFDHGTWSILVHMFPNADIPVFQLSLDRGKTLSQHLEIAKSLQFLRDEGVLILGSGNIVHNLRRIDWNPAAPVFQWAREFDEQVQGALRLRDAQRLVKLGEGGTAESALAVPTPDHYLPLLYARGVADESDEVGFPIEGFQNASISMRSVIFGH